MELLREVFGEICTKSPSPKFTVLKLGERDRDVERREILDHLEADGLTHDAQLAGLKRFLVLQFLRQQLTQSTVNARVPDEDVIIDEAHVR